MSPETAEEDALKLAQDTCDKFYEEYEDMYFPDMVKDHIRDIKSIEDVENEKNPPAQYGEAWRIQGSGNLYRVYQPDLTESGVSYKAVRSI